MVTLDRALFGIGVTKEPEQAFVLRTVTGRASVQESVFPVRPEMQKMQNRVVRAAVLYDAEVPVDEFAHGGADGGHVGFTFCCEPTVTCALTWGYSG